MTIAVKDGNGVTQTIDTIDDLVAMVATQATLSAVDTKLGTINTSTSALGAKTDAKNAATDGTSVGAIALLKQISAYLAGTITVAAHAVTQSGSWVLSAGSALIGKVQLSDGTNHAAVRAGSSAAVAGDAAVVVAIRPDSIRDTYAEYETVAASQTDTILGATGAVGDYLATVWIHPATAGCGSVVVKDGTTTIYTFPGGGTTALPTLAPIAWSPGIYAVSAGFKITTGANVAVLAVGDFT